METDGFIVYCAGASRPLLRVLARLACILGLAASAQAALIARAQVAPVVGPTSVIDPDWLRINPQNPSMLFAGASGQLYRSTDAGTTWIRLMGTMRAANSDCPDTIDTPVTLSIDGAHLVAVVGEGCPGNAHLGYTSLFASSDAGSSVDPGGLSGQPEGSLDPYSPIASPAAPLQFYTLVSINGLGYVWHSKDGGHSWAGSDREPHSWVGILADSLSITADPLLPHTVYDNLGILNAHYVPVRFGAVRSDDAGMSWTTIISPTVTPALRTFAIHTSPRLPGTLIGQTADKAIAPDVRYYSDDSGQT